MKFFSKNELFSFCFEKKEKIKERFIYCVTKVSILQYRYMG